MKRSLLAISLTLALFACAFTSCKTPTLESGGAYAPTNAVAGVTNPAPDFAFYAVDSAFDLAFSTVDASFKFERDNRAMLFKINPEIKHSLDKARPVVFKLGQDYAKARAAYQLRPTPEGLSALNTILSKAQAISAAVTVNIKQ